MLACDERHRGVRRRPGRPSTPRSTLDGRPGARRARAVRLRQVDAAARVAGLEPVRGRVVAWDGADLAGVPTHKRGFALMFQDGQLFAHLTVARNVGYALRLRRRPGRRRAGSPSCSRWSGSRGTATGCPRTLSGGERQRVALARVARGRAAAAAARRAAVRARRRPARAAGRRPARHPARGRHHRADGHPRPRGGVRGRRPARGDARRPDRAAGRRSRRSGGRRPTPRPRCSSATPACSTAPRPPGCCAAAGLPAARRGRRTPLGADARAPTVRCRGDGGLGAGHARPGAAGRRRRRDRRARRRRAGSTRIPAPGERVALAVDATRLGRTPRRTGDAP